MIHNFFSVVTRHWISLVGAVIALVVGVLIVTFFVMEVAGFVGGAYLGILTYMILPMVLVFGLLLIPVGVWRKNQLDKAAQAHHEAAPRGLPVIDLNNERTRGVLLASIFVGLVSLVVIAGAMFKGVEVMESVAFCGTVCHTVMEPQHTAFQRSSHSKLRCADCHIGPGADWFVKSKISGSWQLVSVAFNLYPTPIPNPVHNLRPARDTCEQCHWPTRHVGDLLSVRTKFAADETNSMTKTVLLMKVGGQQGTSSTGIHWHVDPGVSVRYKSDPARQKIAEVELQEKGKPTRRFVNEAVVASGVATEWRTMDCVDCHNRPSHIYRMPEAELDAALEEKRIDPSLPFVRREGLRILKAEYPTHDAARAGISKALVDYYASADPATAGTRAKIIEAAGKELGNIWCWNVFPEMKVAWGTYRVNIGHANMEPVGCFRCHSGELTSKEGESVTSDCTACHSLLAQDEKDPAILKTLIQ